MDGTAVESAFALLLTKVTKPPYPALVLESGVRNMMIKRTISGMIGTGSLAHNRREFIAENVDPDRVQLNICYQNENLKEVYKELFDEAVER